MCRLGLLPFIALSAINALGVRMAIYKTRWFDRWARKKNLSTRSLCEAVREMEAGLYEADLGGGLLKKRLRAPGKEKAAAFVRW